MSTAFENSKDNVAVSQGEEKPIDAFKVFFHLVTEDRSSIETHYTDAQKSLTLEQCATILSEHLKKPMNNLKFRLSSPDSEDLNAKNIISNILKEDDCDVFVFYETVKPIIKEKEKQEVFETITKYSFLDEKKHVKVYLPLEGIGKVPTENIHSRFLDRSFEIKIYGYEGKNWIFAIPKTQCQVFIKESSVLKKENKLIIKIGKIAEGDNWFTLHKTRCVGEKELD